MKNNEIILEDEIAVLRMVSRSVSVGGGCCFVTDEKWALREIILKSERVEGSDFFKVLSEQMCRQPYVFLF